MRLWFKTVRAHSFGSILLVLALVLRCFVMHQCLIIDIVLEIGSAMAVTGSEANFRARAVALGLGEPTINSLCTNGINTISKFAFSSSYVPGAADEAPFTDARTTAACSAREGSARSSS